MAIQGTSLRALEHDWYATRSGLPTNASTDAHKHNYFISKGFGGNASIHPPLGQMESDWLASVGSSTANNPYELWLNACQAQNCKTDGGVDTLKYNFFTHVASGTNP